MLAEPSGAPCIPAGQIAERTDARGVTVGYYDGSTFTAKYPSSLDPPTQVVPTDRVGYVVYEYDAAGQLSKITAKSGPGSDGVIVTENKFDHDEHGNLTAEWQQRGQAVGTGSPKIDYLWSYAPTGTTPDAIGRTRLTKMTYPAQCGQTRREVSLGYGTGADDLLSRIASLTTNLGAPTTIGQFTWMGTGRRSSTTLGGGAIVQDAHLGSEVGLAGLDSFGRTIDLHYRDGASTSDSTLFRGRYAYDASGNRTAARITQAASPSDNLRSQLNTYNGLDQLTGSTVGTLNSDNTALETGTSPRRTDAWNLDVLGNWNGNGKLDAGNNALPGRATSTYLDGPAGTRLLFDASDNQNRVDNRTVDTGSSGGPTTTHYAYDASGNLLCDGVYYYQYDAWNRLVQVNQAAQQTLTGGQTVLASDGVTQLSYIWAPAAFVKHFTYDGLGRLVRTLSPYPDVSTANGQRRSESFYYDGIRRIQEVVADPVISQGDAIAEGGEVGAAAGAAQGGSEQPLDPEGTPVVVEQAQLTGGSAPTGTFLNREYIWGPGDRGVDELLCQYDWQGKPWFTIVDDGGDLVALCDRDPSTLRGRVCAEYTYDAYGAVLTAATYGSMSANAHPHLGHKGLFVDRLDAGVVTTGNYENPRLVPLSSPLCQNRNRAYMPNLGRFLQQDPNESGQSLLAAASYNGRGMGALSIAFGLEDHYSPGPNHYEYLTSNPWLARDPLGLEPWDPFDMVDDYAAEHIAESAAALDNAYAGTQAAKSIAANILTFIPVIGAVGEIWRYMLGEQSLTATIAWSLVDIVPLLGGYNPARACRRWQARGS